MAKKNNKMHVVIPQIMLTTEQKLDDENLYKDTEIKKVLYIATTSTQVNEGMLAEHNEISRLRIGPGIKKICSFGFAGCKNLTELTFLGDDLKEIGSFAFARCVKLEKVVIPYGVDFIGENAFAGCDKLKIVRVPETAEFDDTVFSNCPLLGKEIHENN